MPRFCASAIMAETMLAASRSVSTSRTNERSIFRMSNGHVLQARERRVARCRSRRSRVGGRGRACPRRIAWVRSGSIMAVDSVISTVSRAGSMPAGWSRDMIRSTTSGCQSCRGDRLKLISSVEPVGAPRRVLPAELLDDPVADRFDQAHLLRERDELARLDQATARLRPADQRFDADHAPRGEVDQRLVVEHPALVLDGLPQPRAERQLAHGVGVARRVHERPAGTHLLAAEHRVVGVPQDRLGVVAVVREDADARATPSRRARCPRPRTARATRLDPGRDGLGHDRGGIGIRRDGATSVRCRRGASGTRRLPDARPGRSRASLRAGARRGATISSSPASCPRLSFTSLKLSMSTR